MKNFLGSFLGAFLAVFLLQLINMTSTEPILDSNVTVDSVTIDSCVLDTTLLDIDKVTSQVPLKSIKRVFYPRVWSKGDLIYLVQYSQTQQGSLDADFWGVVQTIVNRCKYNNCSMETYYFTQSINNSRTLSLIHQGKRKDKDYLYDPNDAKDQQRMRIAKAVTIGRIPDSLYLSPDVLYFESHPISWNTNRKTGCFQRKYIVKTLVHEFYYNPEYRKFLNKDNTWGESRTKDI